MLHKHCVNDFETYTKIKYIRFSEDEFNFTGKRLLDKVAHFFQLNVGCLSIFLEVDLIHET